MVGFFRYSHYQYLNVKEYKMPERRTDLIELLGRANIDRNEMADKLNIAYNNLTAYLNGYATMPEDIEREIKFTCQQSIREWYRKYFKVAE